MRKLKLEFEDLAARFEDDVRGAVEEHLGVTKRTLDMVRSEHVALESERDPEFRVRVAEELGHVKEGVERVQAGCGVA
jgi:hypothetical protein